MLWGLLGLASRSVIIDLSIMSVLNIMLLPQILDLGERGDIYPSLHQTPSAVSMVTWKVTCTEPRCVRSGSWPHGMAKAPPHSQ